MSQQNTSNQIGQAWGLSRQGKHREAVTEFERIASTAPDSVDAHYGLGLAQRGLGNKTAAIEAFREAQRLAQNELARLRGGGTVNPEDAQAPSNDLNSTEDDRYLMLVRMIAQRLAELGESSTAR
jgi:tetratricopeptide (TPR) repeat protein